MIWLTIGGVAVGGFLLLWLVLLLFDVLFGPAFPNEEEAVMPVIVPCPLEKCVCADYYKLTPGAKCLGRTSRVVRGRKPIEEEVEIV